MTATAPEARPNAAQAASQRRSRRIPEPRFGIVGIRREPRDPPSEDEPPPARRIRLRFRRTASVHHHVGPIEAFLKMPLVGFEVQRLRLDAGRVRDHAVGGDDDIGLDAKRADHAARYS